MRTPRRLSFLLLIAVLFFGAVETLAAGGSPPPTVVRDAYLQQLGANSVIIRFRTVTTLNTTPVVEYGTSPGVFDQSATGSSAIPPSGGGDRQFTVPLVGLTPETTYYYRFGTQTDGAFGGGGESHRFTTAAANGSNAPLAVWVVGDSGTGLPEQRAVRDSMLSRLEGEMPDLILHAGDLAYENGTDQEFTDNFFGPYASILSQVPIWPTFGNHDADSATSLSQIGPYYEAFELPTAGEFGGAASGTEAYYSFDLHNVHFIVIDTADTDIYSSTTMTDWIAADLANHLADWVVAIFHHPPYSKGTHDSDDGFDSGGRLVIAREFLVPVLEAGGVDLVLSGHSHGYERSFLIDGVWGDGTFPNFATPDFNSLVTDGRILDSGDGRPEGDGAYEKTLGGAGQVSVIAGHGGRTVGGVGGHPVISAESFEYGSCILRIEGDLLWLENLRVDGAQTDRFVISKGTAPFTTEVAVEGSGRVERSPQRPLYLSGETVEFRAIPAEGWQFDGWEGALTGSNAEETLTVAGDATVTARFIPADDRLFTAYNDLAWVPGQSAASITTITSPNGVSGLPSSGVLVDRTTGDPIGVTLSVIGGWYDGAVQGIDESGAPLPGTDADVAFGDHLNAHGSIGPLDLPAPMGDLLLVFTDLDPTQRFELVLYGNRNDEGWQTASEVALLDAASFRNVSSSADDNPDPMSGGALFAGETDASTRLPSQNERGYVARFTEIDPGPDGMVTLRLRSDGTDLSSNGGKFANAVALIAEAGPSPFLRGDVNFSGVINVADAVTVISFLFLTPASSPVDDCPIAADVNGDEIVDVADPIGILAYLFAGGPAPVAPWPLCTPFTATLNCSTTDACP